MTNLIRNSKFEGLDWWALKPTIGYFQDASSFWTIDGTQSSPEVGCNVLKLTNAGNYLWFGDITAWHPFGVNDSVTPYTVSFYARGLNGGEQITFYYEPGSSINQTFTLTTTFQRYSYTYTPLGNSWVKPTFNTANGNTLWFVAPQLEMGSSATDWAIAPEDATPVIPPPIVWSTIPSVVTNFQRYMLVNGTPFRIRGIAADMMTYPNGYLSRVVKMGFNTIITWPPYPYNVAEISNFLSQIANANLYCLLGGSIVGGNLTTRLADYVAMINAVKMDANAERIAAWYPLDESGFSDAEHQTVYTAVKAADPSRSVLVNFIAPETLGNPGVGHIPTGGYGSMDVMSTDNYVGYFDDTTVHSMARWVQGIGDSLQTARLNGKLYHSYLTAMIGDAGNQIREMTANEHRVAAYMLMIYGAMRSYWQVGFGISAAKDEVVRLNLESAMLDNLIFLHQRAVELYPPTLSGDILYCIWGFESNGYLIAIKGGQSSENLLVSLSTPLAGGLTLNTAFNPFEVVFGESAVFKTNTDILIANMMPYSRMVVHFGVEGQSTSGNLGMNPWKRRLS